MSACEYAPDALLQRRFATSSKAAFYDTVMAFSPEVDATLRAVAERFGTPVYVYDLDTIRARVEQLRRALPDADLFYAVKANPCGAVLRHLAGLGLGAEVITEGELARALRAGIPAERILLGGPRQDARLIAAARAAHVGWVSLDSLSQAESWAAQLVTARFLVRLNPALDPRTHEHLATGAATSKFGLPLAETVRVAERLGERLTGFHVHIGSQISNIGAYDEVFRQLSELLARFPYVRTLDLGGGFAVPDFPLAAFAEKVRAFVGERAVLLEPGRFLVADSGTLLTRVLHVKDGPVKHVICDAGMADLLRPALYGARHPIRVVSKSGCTEAATEIVDIDGPLCENADRLGRGVSLPEVQPDDLLAVAEAGAYGLTMSSPYASSLRPAEVVLEGGAARLVRERERVEDLWRLERD
jgi:diaminopimelate decarboxylase